MLFPDQLGMGPASAKRALKFTGESCPAPLGPLHEAQNWGTSGLHLSSRGCNADQQCMDLLHKAVSPLSRGCAGEGAHSDVCRGPHQAAPALVAYRHGQSKAPMQGRAQLDAPAPAASGLHNALVRSTAGLIMMFVISHSFIMYPRGCAEGSVPALISLTTCWHPLLSPSRMAVWAVLLPLLLGILLFQARPVLTLAASYMIVAMSTWVLMACRALCAWQGSIRQAGSGIMSRVTSSVELGQIGLMKVTSAAMPACKSAAALSRLLPSQEPTSLLAAG